jgi:hypothetical protein
MWEIPDKAELQQRVGRQLLGPLEDAMSLAGRYREVDEFRDYIGERAHLVIPALVLIGVTAFACGMAPVMALVGVRVVSALAGLLLAPVMLIGSLFVLALVFFSWLEERSLARTLGRRTAREPKAMRWIRKKLGADLGRPPRVPWLLAAVFVALPFAMLLNFVPAVAAILLALLVAAPFAYARLDR